MGCKGKNCRLKTALLFAKSGNIAAKDLYGDGK
jgi:hypothetical protein